MANKFYGTGRRKKSIARVYVVPGTGKITINKRDIDFPAGFPDCTCSQRVYHRDLRLVPDGGADLQRYLKRKEFVFRGRLHTGSKSLLACFQGGSARRNA